MLEHWSWPHVPPEAWQYLHDPPVRQYGELCCLSINRSLNWVFIVFFFFFIWSRLFHSFWAESIVRWGEIGRSPEKKHLTTRKQNLACLTCDPSEAQTHSGEMRCDLATSFQRKMCSPNLACCRSDHWSAVKLFWSDFHILIYLSLVYIRSWSPKANHLLPLRKWCFYAGLVKIHQSNFQIECRQGSK